jgi:hypothetical protein
MDRKRAMGLLAAVLAILAVVFALLEATRTPDWEIALRDYLARDAAREIVCRVAPASRPWHFTPQMGRAVIQDWTWEGIALPYPPERAICVLATGGGRARLLFVCYHSDNLWRSGWVVHKGPESPFTPADREILRQIGCDLALVSSGSERHAQPASEIDKKPCTRGAGLFV